MSLMKDPSILSRQMIIMSGTTVFGPNGSEYEVVDYLGSGSFGSCLQSEAPSRRRHSGYENGVDAIW